MSFLFQLFTSYFSHPIKCIFHGSVEFNITVRALGQKFSLTFTANDVIGKTILGGKKCALYLIVFVVVVVVGCCCCCCCFCCCCSSSSSFSLSSSSFYCYICPVPLSHLLTTLLLDLSLLCSDANNDTFQSKISLGQGI